MTVTYLILVIVHLAAIGGRCRYELLKRSGRVDTRRRLVFGLVFADMVVLWAAWFGMGPLDPVRLSMPGPVRWAGLALTVAGGVLFVGTVLSLRALENTTVLVTTGLFALTRHPAYLGFVLWLVGWPPPPVACPLHSSLAPPQDGPARGFPGTGSGGTSTVTRPRAPRTASFPGSSLPGHRATTRLTASVGGA